MEELRILFLEDIGEDAELAIHQIKKGAIDHSHVRVDNLNDFEDQLEEYQPHIIVSDYNLPTCNALDAFDLTNKQIPFIILSGAIGEEKAVEALKLGVTDYVSKESLSRLPYVINRAINEKKVREEKAKAEEELVQSKERLELALVGSELGTWDWDIKTNMVIYDKRAADIFGHSFSDLEEDLSIIYEKVHPESLQEAIKALRSHFLGESKFFECEMRIKKNNKWTWVSVKGKIIKNLYDKDAFRASGTVRDINEVKIQQEKLIRSQQLLNEAHQIAKIGSFEWTLEQGFTQTTDEFHEIFDVDQEGLTSHRDFYFNHVHPEDKEFVFAVFFREKQGRQDYELEHRIKINSGAVKVIRSKGQITFNEKEQIVRVVGTVLDITEQKQTKKTLYRGQELERQRVAREIHDGIGQMLIATKYKLSSVNDQGNETIGKSIEEVEGFLDSIIEETRRISRNLSSKMVDEFGLSKALELMIDELQVISGLKITGKIERIKNLSNDVSITVYRIMQEAISNAIKYADASEIEIDLEKQGMSVLLSIRDNGKGFDKFSLNGSKGSGLKNMKDRASALNGHFEVVSSKKNGTLVRSWLPISSDQES